MAYISGVGGGALLLLLLLMIAPGILAVAVLSAATLVLSVASVDMSPSGLMEERSQALTESEWLGVVVCAATIAVG